MAGGIFGAPVSSSSTSGGGGDTSALQARIDTLENNLGVNTLRDAVNGGWTVFNMIDGMADEYEDETGVSSNTLIYDQDGDYYGNTTDVYDLVVPSNTTDGSTTFTDSTGLNTLTPNGDVQHDTAQAQFGTSSILFDGTGDYISAPDNARFDLGANDFTMGAWCRVTSLGSYCITSQWATGSSQGFVFQLNTAEVTFFYSTTGANLLNVQTTGSPISINTWHYVVAERNGNTLNIYVDGVVRGTGDFTGVTIFNSTRQLELGIYNGATAPFNGWMDDIFIANGTAIYQGAFTNPTSAIALSNDGNVVSDTFTANSAPDYARFVILHEPLEGLTLNTDCTIEVSRDGGTTWSSGTLAKDADFNANIEILTTGDIDISAQPSGTSMVYRFTTANLKSQRIHGAYLQWR